MTRVGEPRLLDDVLIRFIVEGIPKLQLITKCMERCKGDLFGFTVLFMLALVAFAFSFWVYFGSVIPAYYSPMASVMTTTRGDARHA